MSENQTIKDRLLEYIEYIGVGQAKFEKMCGLSNGYINNIKGNFSAKKIEDILKTCTDLNRLWLLTGEGEMLNPPVFQTSHGDNSPNIANNKGNVNVSYNALGKALDEIAEMRKLLDKSIQNNKEQADKFFALIELIKNTDK